MVETLGGILVERFVRTFFEATAPFVDMWQDLLALFECVAASVGSQQLDIEYYFSGERPDKLPVTADRPQPGRLRARYSEA